VRPKIASRGTENQIEEEASTKLKFIVGTDLKIFELTCNLAPTLGEMRSSYAKDNQVEEMITF
jgi:hypothetical protein